MNLSFADPWDFMNGDPVLLSPAGDERIEYEELHEIGMSAPLGGVSYLVKDNQRYLIDETCAGPAIWNVSGKYAAIPLWTTGFFNGGMQRIGIVVIDKIEMFIYKRKFRLLHLKSFDGSVVTAVDSPIHKRKELEIDLSKEKVHKRIPLRAAQ